MAKQMGRAEVVLDVKPGFALEQLALLERQRDEARNAARQFFEACEQWGSFPPGGKQLWIHEMIMRWPWLDEDKD